MSPYRDLTKGAKMSQKTSNGFREGWLTIHGWHMLQACIAAHCRQIPIYFHTMGGQTFVSPAIANEIWALSQVTRPTNEMKISSGASQSHRGDELFEIVQYTSWGPGTQRTCNNVRDMCDKNLHTAFAQNGTRLFGCHPTASH
jgi:hypothetical protein